MIGPYQVDLSEDGTARQVVRVDVNVTHGVAVRNGPGVEGSIIPVRARTIFLLGDQVEGG
jgi:hypothetical protein